MIKWFNEPVPQLSDCVLSMGNFDGLHLGHQSVLKELLHQAGKLKATPVLISYLEHPGHFIYFKQPVSILTPRVIKKELFKELGITNVYFLNFNSETAHVSAYAFLKDAVIGSFRPKLIISGYDTHFGYHREGNSDFLRKYEPDFGYSVLQVAPVTIDGQIVSSSLIREKLAEGNLSVANKLLGKPYSLYGTVTYGQKIGRTIGFPTINMSLLDSEQLIPANGVYLSRINLLGKFYFGLTNIGISPTLKSSEQIEIETHVLDYDGDVFDGNLRIDLYEFLREEKLFASTQELRAAIYEDIKQGREIIKRYVSDEKHR